MSGKNEINPQNQVDFLTRISSIEAHECIHQIQAYFARHSCAKVHFTGTSNGDLRVKAIYNDKWQNIFTMDWKPSYSRFLCRMYQINGNVQNMPLISNPRKPTSTTEPLQIEFDYTPKMQNGVLINLIDVAVAVFCQT